MYDPAKVCPECRAYNAHTDAKCRGANCPYEFVGDELGSSLEPIRVETVDSTLSQDAIAERQRALRGEPGAQDTRKEDLRIFIRAVAASVGIAAIGAVFFALALSFKKGPSGQSGLGATIVASVGILAFLSAVINLISAVWRFLLPPKFSTAKQLGKVFFAETLGLAGGGATRAWNALDGAAKAEFASLEEFKAHFKRRKAEAEQWGLEQARQLPSRRPANYRGKPEAFVFAMPAEVSERTPTVADVTCDLLISVSEVVEVGKNLAGNPNMATIYHAKFIWPQRKTALKSGDRWYLTSGSVDGPAGGVA